MAQYVTRTGAVTANTTSTSLTGQGSVSSPGGITVPNGVTQLVQVIATVGEKPATTTGGHIYFLRISGNAIQGTGEVDICLGAVASVLTTLGAASTLKPAAIIPMAVPVVPGNNVSINADSDGTGTQTARVAVTLVFA